MAEKYSEAFLDAARYGELEDLRLIFGHEQLRALIDFRLLVDPEAGHSPLMLAAGNGHLECMQFLVTQVGVNVNHQNASGNSALHWAALNGHADCVALLINSGANVALANRGGRTPFDEALIRDRKDCCEVIAKREVELIMQTAEPDDEDLEMDL